MVLPARHPGQHSVSAKPRPDESLTGYIFRLAARRRLKTAFQVAASAGFNRFTNRPRREWLEALATLAEVPFADLEAMSFGLPDDAVGWFRGIELPTLAFDRRGGHERRVCPLCLDESQHHRAIWDLIFIAVCPVHAARLLDTCPTCGQPLRWLRLYLMRCRCNADLTRLAVESVAKVELRGTEAVHGLLGDDRFREAGVYAESLEPFRDLSRGKIIEFLFRIGLESVGGRRHLFSFEKPGTLAWEADVALNRGLRVAERWPDAYFEVLELMRVRSGQSDWKEIRLRTVVPVERWLKRIPEDSGRAIRLATAEYRTEFRTRGRDVARQG